MSPNAKGALFALLAFAIFSTHDVIVRILGSTYAPFQIVFYSVLLSFPLAIVMLMRDVNPGEQQAAAGQNDDVAQLAFATRLTGRLEQELHGRPLNGLVTAPVDQVNDHRNRGEGQAPQEQW